MSYMIFRSNKGKYIFDNNSGYVLTDTGVTSDILKNYNDVIDITKMKIIQEQGELFDEMEFKAQYNLIKQCIENGMLVDSDVISSNIPRTLEDTKEMCFSLNSAVLILVLTENCNMRCEYCIYSDRYPKEIGYTDTKMDLGTAEHAVNLFCEVYKERCRHGYRGLPRIGFYGGEPLLCFNEIQHIVAYAKNILPNTRFSITTNGTIMTKEIIQLLTDECMDVTFSLDGYKENHDRNRVFPNSKGTFDIVLENIKSLQNYKKLRGNQSELTFNCCFDEYTDLERVIMFFNDHYNLFKPFRLFLSQINPYDTTYYQYCENRFSNGSIFKRHDVYKEMDWLFEAFLNKKFGEKTSSLMNLLFGSVLTFLTRNKGCLQSSFNNS